MQKTTEPFITVRVKEGTWKRLRIKAAKEQKFIWEVVDDLSKVSPVKQA